MTSLQIRRQHPNLVIDGTNPFWLLDAAYTMFDQSTLEEPLRFMEPMLQFQETLLIMAALYQYVKAAAPSQSGKTTAAEILAATCAYAFPGQNTLILSTIEDQSERLRQDIRDKLIKCHRVEENRELTIDSASEGKLKLKCNGSQIIALPHSIKALTGNPAQTVILDELEKWDKEPAKIYAEAVARTGQTGGRVFVISSVDTDGEEDLSQPQGYRGSFFYQMLKKDWKNRANPEKPTIAARFTYHVSPFLMNNIDKIRQEVISTTGEQYFNAHYLSKPRKAAGKAIFDGFFKRDVHVRPEAEVPLNPNEPLFLCIDPGLNKAAVLGQLDPDHARLMYLRCWMAKADVLFGDFVQSVMIRARKAFPHFEIQYFADFAAKQQNNQTNLANADIIATITGQYPAFKYQHIAPGIQAMKSFMKRVDAFYVSDQCAILADAFESGLVAKEVRGVTQEEWVKDGHWEHPGDAARYPVLILCGGYSADALAASGGYAESVHNPGADPITGYG